MAAFVSARALAASQERRFGIVVRSIRLEHKKLAHKMADRMVDLASGNISTDELRRRGHPFGRGKGRATLKLLDGRSGKQSRFRTHRSRYTTPTPLLPINRQTGRLVRSIRVIPEAGGLQSYRVQFTAPHAKFVLALGGTKRMVARGYWPEMRRIWTSENKKTVYQMRLHALKVMYGRA